MNLLLAKVCGLAAVVALLAFLFQNLEHKVVVAQAALAEEKAGRLTDQRNYAVAVAAAGDKERQRLTRVVQEQRTVDDARVSSLRTRLADAARLRLAPRAPDASAGGGPARVDVPGVSPAACRVDAAPAVADALIRYDELISWVEQTASIDPNSDRAD